MKTLKILTKLKELGTIEAVTGGRNGYPTPEIGLAFIPNDEEALGEAQILIPDSKLYEFHSRDGWSMIELNGELYEGLENYDLSSLDFGDDYTIIKVENEDEIEEIAQSHIGYKSWGYDSWKEVEVSGDMNSDEINDSKELVESLSESLEVGLNVVRNGISEDTLSNLGYSHDTHKYSVGLFIDRDEEKGQEIWEEEYK